MAYRLKLREAPGDGFKRVGREQLRVAGAALAAGVAMPTAVHDARKALKRLRALIAGAAPCLERGQAKQLRALIAATARGLGPIREIAVMRETLKRLSAHYEIAPAGAFDRVGGALEIHPAIGAGVALAAVRPSLGRLAKEFERITFDTLTLPGIAHAMGATLAKGRRRFEHAFETLGDEDMHQWRKAVQLHWRHMALVADAWPEAFSARVETAKRLSHLSGEDNDLATLIRFVDTCPDGVRAVDRAVVSAVCRLRQGELRTLTRPLGERLFTLDAVGLAETITVAWRTAPLLRSTESNGGFPGGQINTLMS